MMSMKHLSLDDSQTQILKACSAKDLLKTDRISGLPDDILICILSSLTLKEAGRTSVLSKRWRNAWAYVPSLQFNSGFNIYKIGSLSVRRGKHREEEHKYVRWVNEVVTSHKADIIDEFRVNFIFKENSKENIDNWLRFAMAKRVKRLQLDITGGYPTQLSYNLPLLSPGVPLTSLQLRGVNVTGEDLEKLLHDTPTLEFVSVTSSASLVKLKVAGLAPNLKSLIISRCYNMEDLEISAPKLVSFYYVGSILLNFPIICTPKLTELTIGGLYGDAIMGNFMSLSSIFRQIEVFSLTSFVSDGRYIPHEFPVGPRLRMLELDIQFIYTTEDQLFEFSYLIQGCPFLQKFSLELGIYALKVAESEEERKEACPHHHLKIVELSGFFGSEPELRFAEYLMESAVSLEKMIIKVDCKLLNPDARIQPRENAKRLHASLKPGVHLEIL